MKPLVLCDMDEVLVDLEGAMEKFFPGSKFRKNDPNRVTPSIFFQLLAPFSKARQFKDIDIAHGALMLEHIYRIYSDRVDFAVCTSRGHYIKNNLMILEDKAYWLQQKFPNSFAQCDLICTMSGENKSRYAKPHVLLIDDQKKNCETFIQAGGHALVYAAGTTTHTEVCDAIDKLLV